MHIQSVVLGNKPVCGSKNKQNTNFCGFESSKISPKTLKDAMIKFNQTLPDAEKYPKDELNNAINMILTNIQQLKNNFINNKKVDVFLSLDTPFDESIPKFIALITPKKGAVIRSVSAKSVSPKELKNSFIIEEDISTLGTTLLAKSKKHTAMIEKQVLESTLK